MKVVLVFLLSYYIVNKVVPHTCQWFHVSYTCDWWRFTCMW